MIKRYEDLTVKYMYLWMAGLVRENLAGDESKPWIKDY